MPLREHITRPLLPGKMYHLYNRGNEVGTRICFDEDNYRYFLRCLARKMNAYMQFYAFCVLPDHYHLMVRIRTEQEVLQAATRDIKQLRPDMARAWGLPPRMPICQFSENWQMYAPALRERVVAWAVAEQYRRCMLGYTKALNKRLGRRGSLMQKPFRRKLFEELASCKRLIRYIHQNPSRHGHVSDFRVWPWSSWQVYLGEGNTDLPRQEVFAWFGGRDGFVEWHRMVSQMKQIDEP